MTDIAIRVENLGKRYQLGASKSGSFRESMSRLFHRNGPASHPASNPTSHPENPPIPNPPNPIPTEFWALHDINFEIKRGEAVGIIGRNGAGKSTLLKILSRITEPTRGRFEIFGRVSSLLEVGTGFHPELTGRENVYLNGTILGMKRREVKAKFDEIVAFSGVEKFIDTPVKHYSSGMQVRLAFAVAAHLEPEILIIDEVLAVGDAEFQKKCLGKMEDVTGEGRTVLFVSHNMAAVKALCSKGILLRQGVKEFEGKTEEIIDRYINGNVRNKENSTPGICCLSDRKNIYTKNKETIIEKLTLTNAKGKITDTFLMGETMELIVDLTGMSIYRGANIGVIFKTSDDQWVTSFTTVMRNADIEGARSYNEQAVLTVQNIPFTAGDVFIDISISQPNSGRLDYVDRAARISIEGNDVYGTGTLVDNYFGLVYIDGCWKIRTMEQPLTQL